MKRTEALIIVDNKLANVIYKDSVCYDFFYVDKARIYTTKLYKPLVRNYSVVYDKIAHIFNYLEQDLL